MAILTTSYPVLHGIIAILTPSYQRARARAGGHPYLRLFDLEKAFDSIEHSILLERLFEIGVNGRCWRIILNWYTSAQGKVHLNTGFSDPFPISRGVKQGSVLSPLLFLIAVDPLLKTLKCKHDSLSIHGNFMGGAAHADDLRTIATSKCSVVEQANIIDKFTSGNREFIKNRDH